MHYGRALCELLLFSTFILPATFFFHFCNQMITNDKTSFLDRTIGSKKQIALAVEGW